MTNTRMNSKDKGKRGERLWVAALSFFGFRATRTGHHQSQSGCESPDVTCSATSPIHWEVKFSKTARLGDWMAQAKGDAKDWQGPVVVWRNKGKWVAIFPDAENLLELLQHADLRAFEEQKQLEQKK